MHLLSGWLMASSNGGGVCLFSTEQLCRRSANGISSESWKAAATLKITLISLSPCSSHFMGSQWEQTWSTDKPAVMSGLCGALTSVPPDLLISSVSCRVSVIIMVLSRFCTSWRILWGGECREGFARWGDFGVFSDADGEVGGRRSPFTPLSWKWWGRIF